MAITAKLAAKVGGVVGLSGMGVTGIYLGSDYVSNFLSKYELALIDFLSSDKDNDIVFAVTQKDNTMIDYKGSSGDSISAKVQISSGTNESLKTGGKNSAITDKPIKSLGESWTWECAFSFRKNKGISKNDIKNKDRIIKGDGEGLFGILKQDVSKYTKGDSRMMNKDDLKKVKIEFIRQCGYERGVSRNKEINNGRKTETKDIKISVREFMFAEKSGEEKLVPEDDVRFRHWFKERYENRNK